MKEEEIPDPDQPVILFDGICNLCSGAVRFVYRRDSEKVFRFASLQSEAGKNLLQDSEIEPGKLDTIVLVDGEEIYESYRAVVKILGELGGFWKVLSIFMGFIPVFIGDFFYNLVARSRYTVFGKKEECMVPEEGLKDRFIDS